MNAYNAGSNSTPTPAYRHMTALPDKLMVRLDVFIINTQVHPPQNVYIKTAMKDSTLVLMAEAAALALAVTVTDRLQLNHINFLSDSQQLVQFLNSSDHSNPPDWRIKPFTQIITQGRSTSIGVKVSRNMNHTADLLARQTLRACLVPPLKFSPYHIGCLTHA